jgi:hypothetical protein
MFENDHFDSLSFDNNLRVRLGMVWEDDGRSTYWQYVQSTIHDYRILKPIFHF